MLVSHGIISIQQAFKNKLQTAQNKVLRFFLQLHVNSRSHVGIEELRSLAWLPVNT